MFYKGKQHLYALGSKWTPHGNKCVSKSRGTRKVKSIPIFSNVCPWDLLIVIAKASLTGNCLRLKLKG